MRKTTAPSELTLDLLLVLYEEARGSADLADAVGELRGKEVPLATFYRQLQRACDHGWVAMEEPSEGRRQESERQRPGRPERLYRITERGGRALRFGVEEQRRRVSRAAALGLLLEKSR